MTISPAAHSPYASGGTPQGGGVHGPPSLPSQSPHNMPQPQPSPQPSQTQQQQQQQVSNPVPSGRQAVQAEQRSPHTGQQLQYAQQHQHPAQMQHHLQQQMSRFYGQYPNYAAAAAMSAQHPHHLGRLQAAGMASMFPPNPMFNLHPPTTPPKQSAASQSSRAAGVTGSNPAQYTPTTSGSSHRSATSLARLQQLTNGLENTPGGGGSDPSGVSAVPTSGNPTGNSIPGAKPSKQNSALLAPSYYPGQQPGQPQTPVGHHPNTPGVPGSIPASHGRPETPASRNHQNLIAHQYSAQNHMALNYPGYPPGYLNPWNMYHQAAADAHHQRSVSAAAAHHQATHSGVPGSNPAAAPHHHAHQMYPGYPGLPGYNYHR